MSRARWVAEDRRSSLTGEWLKAPQRCLAALVGARDGKSDYWVCSSIVHVDSEVPVRAARGQWCVRGAGRGRCCGQKPFEWDPGSDFTACYGGGRRCWGRRTLERRRCARCCRADRSVSVRLLEGCGQSGVAWEEFQKVSSSVQGRRS